MLGYEGSRAAAIDEPSLPVQARDNVVVSLTLDEGSIGTIVYVAAGSAAVPKKRVEVFASGRTAILDDYKRLELFHRRSQAQAGESATGQRVTTPRCELFSIRSKREQRRWRSMSSRTRVWRRSQSWSRCELVRRFAYTPSADLYPRDCLLR